MDSTGQNELPASGALPFMAEEALMKLRPLLSLVPGDFFFVVEL